MASHTIPNAVDISNQILIGTTSTVPLRWGQMEIDARGRFNAMIKNREDKFNERRERELLLAPKSVVSRTPKSVVSRTSIKEQN